MYSLRSRVEQKWTNNVDNRFFELSELWDRELLYISLDDVRERTKVCLYEHQLQNLN